MNLMKTIRLEKVTINLGAGESGPRLEQAKLLLEKMTQKKILVTKTHKRTTFGMAKKRPVGMKVTLRGSSATELLKKLLQAHDNKLQPTRFDSTGNFSFGIQEYINIPGIKYDPDIGILGMDVCATLTRPGYRVKKRLIKRQKMGKHHQITKEDAMEFAKKELGIIITSGEEE